MNTITRIMGIPVSLLLLTGCTVNAPVNTDVHGNQVDIYDNTVQTPDWKDLVPKNPSNPSNPLNAPDPNASQDLPEPWGEDDVYESSYCELNPTDSACVVSSPNN
jgi:hypothetical protein